MLKYDPPDTPSLNASLSLLRSIVNSKTFSVSWWMVVKDMHIAMYICGFIYTCNGMWPCSYMNCVATHMLYIC